MLLAPDGSQFPSVGGVSPVGGIRNLLPWSRGETSGGGNLDVNNVFIVYG